MKFAANEKNCKISFRIEFVFEKENYILGISLHLMKYYWKLRFSSIFMTFTRCYMTKSINDLTTGIWKDGSATYARLRLLTNSAYFHGHSAFYKVLELHRWSFLSCIYIFIFQVPTIKKFFLVDTAFLKYLLIGSWWTNTSLFIINEYLQNEIWSKINKFFSIRRIIKPN